MDSYTATSILVINTIDEDTIVPADFGVCVILVKYGRVSWRPPFVKTVWSIYPWEHNFWAIVVSMSVRSMALVGMCSWAPWRTIQQTTLLARLSICQSHIAGSLGIGSGWAIELHIGRWLAWTTIRRGIACRGGGTTRSTRHLLFSWAFRRFHFRSWAFGFDSCTGVNICTLQHIV